MGRFEILKTKKINTTKVSLVEPLDENVMLSLNLINKKLGQYKVIVVCETKNGYLIVDGNKYFNSLKKIGVKKVLCHNLGKISENEYDIYRIALNIHQSRLDYLGIAEVVSNLKVKEMKETSIANNTGLDLLSVERYSTLLSFDWDDFNKKQIKEQINPFEDER